MGARVERRERRRHALQATADVHSRLHHRGQLVIVGQRAHHHHVVDCDTVQYDVGHAQIDVGRQSTVELHFAPAIRLPGGAVGEVNEVETDRLAELVDPVPREDQNGDVRIDDPHR